MVISLGGVVQVIVFLIVAACVFGLLFWLLNYIGGKVPAESKPFIDIARVVLVVLAVLVLIGMLLSFAGIGPSIQFRP